MASEFHKKILVHSIDKVAPIGANSPSPSSNSNLEPGDKNPKTRMPWKQGVIVCVLIIVALLIVCIVLAVFLGLQTDRMNHLESSQQRLEKMIKNLTLSQNQKHLPPEQEAQNLTTTLFVVISNQLSEFRINFTIELGQVQTSLLSSISELVKQILADVQLSQQNITTLIVERLAQQELKINQSFEELGNRLEDTMGTLEQRITILNLTLTEENEQLSTENKQLKVQITAMNESLQSTKTELQAQKEDTRERISNISMEIQSSLSKFTAQHSGLLDIVNQTVERQGERIDEIDGKLHFLNRTLIMLTQEQVKDANSSAERLVSSVFILFYFFF